MGKWQKFRKQASLLVEIDEYAGNWEREISGYLFGWCDDAGDHIAGHTIKMFVDQVPEEEKKYVYDCFSNRPVDEYGMMPYEIYWPEGASDCSGIEFFLNEDILEEPERIKDLTDYVKRRFGEGITIPEKFSVRDQMKTAKLVRLRVKIETISEEVIDV